MAVAFDAVTTGSGGGVTSITFAHTNTGSNLGLLVGISLNDTTDKVSGVTYNAVAMSRVTTTNTANFRGYVYKAVAPASGNHNVVVSFSTASQAECGACTFTGCDQVTMTDGSGVGNGTSTSASSTVTSTSTGMIMDCVAADFLATTITVNASQTSRWNAAEDSDVIGGGSTKVNAGSTTMTWTLGSSHEWCSVSVSVAAPAAADFPLIDLDYFFDSPRSRKAQRT